MANKSEAIDDIRRVHQIGADVKRMYRAAEENWRKKRVEKHSRNPRKSWRQLKELIGWTGGGRQINGDMRMDPSQTPKQRSQI